MHSDKEYLVIPHPIKLPQSGGAASLKSSGKPMAVRLHHDDIAQLDDIAHRVGILPATLMRWFIVYGTQQLTLVHTGKKPAVRP